ncbi:hypothetical protein HCN44_000189 [Aphidius gifuensis]|uniref:Acylglycerol kinase, mitochondrial n=1 Tax=Aphidius gifuensis TaxID=684658 RepID=A0A834XSA9_APHGI|nr:hypothetical protein HCN44_000189 [Aphidius gifuensis]
MSRIVGFFKVIRNNWKKSVVGAGVLSYGVSHGLETYQTNLLMRSYCEEAVKFGDEALPAHQRPRHITVILNPTSNKKKSKKLFEKYCEPLLHLAGIAVTIIQTEQEGQARGIIEKLNTQTDAIIVAGGDGTLSDVVTGLMRKYNGNSAYTKQCPIGILPLGEINRTANHLFNKKYDNLSLVHQLADATMATIKGSTKYIDVVELESLENPDPENPIKPIYAVGQIEWGAWRDANAQKDKYWYLGSLRRYATFVFCGLKNNLNWSIDGTLKYTDPCSGCSRCYQDIRNQQNITSSKKCKIINNKCGEYKEMPISSTELSLISSNLSDNSNDTQSSVKIYLGPEHVTYMDFVKEGWRRIKGEKNLVIKTLEAKDIELFPNANLKQQGQQQYFSIDNEEYEVKPVKLRLFSNAVKIFV